MTAQARGCQEICLQRALVIRMPAAALSVEDVLDPSLPTQGKLSHPRGECDCKPGVVWGIDRCTSGHRTDGFSGLAGGPQAAAQIQLFQHARQEAILLVASDIGIADQDTSGLFIAKKSPPEAPPTPMQWSRSTAKVPETSLHAQGSCACACTDAAVPGGTAMPQHVLTHIAAVGRCTGSWEVV